AAPARAAAGRRPGRGVPRRPPHQRAGQRGDAAAGLPAAAPPRGPPPLVVRVRARHGGTAVRALLLRVRADRRDPPGGPGRLAAARPYVAERPADHGRALAGPNARGGGGRPAAGRGRLPPPFAPRCPTG